MQEHVVNAQVFVIKRGCFFVEHVPDSERSPRLLIVRVKLGNKMKITADARADAVLFQNCLNGSAYHFALLKLVEICQQKNPVTVNQRMDVL